MAELNREEKIQKFLDMVEASDNIVFFGGAGVSRVAFQIFEV